MLCGVLGDNDIIHKKLLAVARANNNIDVIYVNVDSLKQQDLSIKRNIDVLFCDLDQKVFSYLEIMKYVESTNIVKHVVAITKTAGYKNIRDLFIAGFFDVIVKPVNIEDISEVLKRVALKEKDRIERSLNNECINLCQKLTNRSYVDSMTNTEFVRRVEKIILTNAENDFELVKERFVKVVNYISDYISLHESVVLHIVMPRDYVTKMILKANDINSIKQCLNEYIDQIISFYQLCYPENKSKLVNDVVTYILSNFLTKISISDIAEQFKINASYLSRIFSNSMGLSVTEFVCQVKMKYVAKELIYNDDNIATIAENVAYYDSKYLSKVFKSQYGLTPSEYRKNNKKSA